MKIDIAMEVNNIARLGMDVVYNEPPSPMNGYVAHLFERIAAWTEPEAGNPDSHVMYPCGQTECAGIECSCEKEEEMVEVKFDLPPQREYTDAELQSLEEQAAGVLPFEDMSEEERLDWQKDHPEKRV